MASRSCQVSCGAIRLQTRLRLSRNLAGNACSTEKRRRSLADPFPHVHETAAAFLAGEFLGPILAWLGEADLERALVDLVDAEHLRVTIHGGDRFRLGGRVHGVRADNLLVADVHEVLVALDDQL